MFDEGVFVGDPGLGSEVLEFGDVLLEPIIDSSARKLPRFLSEAIEIESGGGFDVVGVERGFEVSGEGCERLGSVGGV